MHFKLFLVVLALSWEFSVGEKCYTCKKTLKSSDDAKKDLCAAGEFEKKDIPLKTPADLEKDEEYQKNGKVFALDCGANILCMNKTEKHDETITYTRACAEKDEKANKCEKTDPSCICSGDFCNGTEKPNSGTEKPSNAAANLNGYQAILGTITGVIMIVLSK